MCLEGTARSIRFGSVATVLAVALSMPWSAVAQGQGVYGHGKYHAVRLALLARRFVRELAWLRDGADLDSKLAVERVEGGLRVTGIDGDGRYADLGLRDDDVLRAINGTHIARKDDVLPALEKNRERWELQVWRNGHVLKLVYAVSHARVGGLVESISSPDSSSRDGLIGDLPTPPSPLSDAALFASVRQIDSETWSIDRRAVANLLPFYDDRILSNARIEGVAARGKTIGLRITGIEPGSLLARLGVRNGDELRAVNGIAVDSDDLGRLYASVVSGAATTLRFELQREGRATTLVWIIR